MLHCFGKDATLNYIQYENLTFQEVVPVKKAKKDAVVVPKKAPAPVKAAESSDDDDSDDDESEEEAVATKGMYQVQKT